MLARHRKLVISLYHKLHDIRLSLDLTVKDLADLSGICVTTIHRIESGDSTYKINTDTAKALADALYVKTLEIFRENELSHLGRPPHTGKSLVINLTTREAICPDCRVALPKTGICDDCAPVRQAVSA